MKLFSSKKPNELPSVIEQRATETAYPAVIKQIHNEFNTASDKTLASANEILNTSIIPQDDKTMRLAKLGFTSTQPVLERYRLAESIKESEQVAKMIQVYRERYPLHKFILQDDITAICKKYGLIYGKVSNYVGFVPDRNLKEIESFVIHDKDKAYFRGYLSINPVQWERISSEDYLNESQGKNKWDSTVWGYKEGEEYRICAPLKDMKLARNQYIDERNRVMEHIPDPVVIFPVTAGGIILTAWGEEASDPLIVNEINN